MPDEPARNELLKQIVTARICGNEHVFFVDGIKFAVGRLVFDTNGSYAAIISPFHSIVPGPTESRMPSVARVILATLCPSVVDCDQAVRVWLPVAVGPIAVDQPASVVLSGASGGRGALGTGAGGSASTSSRRKRSTISRELMSRATSFCIVYPDHHVAEAERLTSSPTPSASPTTPIAPSLDATEAVDRSDGDALEMSLLTRDTGTPGNPQWPST
ncbi:hypothetical protein Rt10032_c03g1280 [Rhodotorula toruloides]|uniref:Uncharacterized protein n=1 Tax=Rhodotorula toruloides TaxID=5286 RepID=A0A511KA61_RHOTO|nr:hypothetical protein Rt10032_c03g1280 [Rhodotorula toruloides]